MTSLFDSYELGSMRLPNRLVMAPMTRARVADDGVSASASNATYYAQRATAGLIVSEGIPPSLQGQSNPGVPTLASDEQTASWRPVTDAVHANGGRIFAQLMHGGRVGHPDIVGYQPVGPSAIALEAEVFTPNGMGTAPMPRALSLGEIPGEAKVYADAARRAIDAGFDGVELHGANGYLIQQFLSVSANQRTDAYGGSITGRIRFAVEAVEATVAAIGADRVGIRLSPGGTVWDTVEEDVPEMYSALFAELARLDIAFVDLLATADEEVLVALRKAWPKAFILNPGGQIGPVPTDRAAGEHWLAQGADLIGYGRAYLTNPDLVERFRTGAPLRDSADRTNWYQGSDTGYIDYPSYQY